MEEKQAAGARRWDLWVVNFEEVKKREDFCAVVTLARAINVLHFVHTPLREDDTGPTAVRNQYNAFLFGCALLAEASLLVQNIGKFFRDHESFKKLASVVNSREARELLSDRLFTVRNKLVFHFDMDEVGRQLAELHTTEAIFVSGMGPSKLNNYYYLPDLLAARTCTGPLSPTEGEEIKRIFGAIGNLIFRFLEVADEFLVDVLIERGWLTSERPTSQKA
jgi:hypothetical protein